MSDWTWADRSSGSLKMRMLPLSNPLLATLFVSFAFASNENTLFLPSGVNGPQKWLTKNEFMTVCMLCPMGSDCRTDSPFKIEYKRKSRLALSSWKEVYVVLEKRPRVQAELECRDFFRPRFPDRQIVTLSLAFFESFEGQFALRIRPKSQSAWIKPFVIQTDPIPRVNNQLKFSEVNVLTAVARKEGTPTNDQKNVDSAKFGGYSELMWVYPEKDAVEVIQVLKGLDCLRSLPLRTSDMEFYRILNEQEHPLTESQSVQCVVESLSKIGALDQYEWILDILFTKSHRSAKDLFQLLFAVESQLKTMPAPEFARHYARFLGPQVTFKLPSIAHRIIRKYQISPILSDDPLGDTARHFNDFSSSFGDFFRTYGARFAGAAGGASSSGSGFGGFFGHERSQSNTINDVRKAYATLELQNGASWPEVQRAYRKLMLKYHPDKQQGPNGLGLDAATSTQKSQEITSALEVLKTQFGQ